MADQTIPIMDLDDQTNRLVKYRDLGDGSFGPASLSDPASYAAAVTPNDGADLPNATRGPYVGVAGDVKVDFVDGGTGIILKALAAGIVHPFRVKRVYATGTTATDIVGVR